MARESRIMFAVLNNKLYRWGKGTEEYGEVKPTEVGRVNPHPGVAPVQGNLRKKPFRIFLRQ